MKLQLLLVLFLHHLVIIAAIEENMMWIEQKVDHFNESGKRTWNMRYFSSDEFYKPGGPIIIIVNGEWNAQANSPFFGIVYEIIEMFNAYAFQTEHRYYGLSWPVENLTIENLQYLNMEQALADLAHFIRHQKATIPKIGNSKVILIGCSYAGSLVTYFRKDYPELMDGGWSAAAGLMYKLDYSDAHVSVGRALRKIGGDACYDSVEHFSKSYLIHKKKQDDIYTLLEGQNLTEYFDDVDKLIGAHVQHRNTNSMKRLCSTITLVEKENFVGFGKLLRKLIFNSPSTGELGDIYKVEEHANRQHFYQACNEHGNFFTTSSEHQPFGNKDPFSKVIAKCKKHFGPKFTIDYISGKVDELNEKYGGQTPSVDHIYFTKAEDDPWRWMGIIDECATIIPGIGHCHELRTRNLNDSAELKAAQQKGIDLIRDWINGNGTTRETLIKC